MILMYSGRLISGLGFRPRSNDVTAIAIFVAINVYNAPIISSNDVDRAHKKAVICSGVSKDDSKLKYLTDQGRVFANRTICGLLTHLCQCSLGVFPHGGM